MSRLQEKLSGIPPSTRSIMALCVLTYACQVVLDPTPHLFTMCPRNVLYLHEYYRFVTSPLFHGSLMHIAMNMMSTMAIGSMLERILGTLLMGITILWGIFLTSAIYVIMSSLPWLMFGHGEMMMVHSLGFSGVIFQLSVLESNLSPNRTRSVFGISVGSKVYPWALLVILQLIMPHVSFLGHLSGILVGTLQFSGALDVLFPSETYLGHLEMSDQLQWLRTQSGYVMVPESGVWRREALDVWQALSLGFGFAAVFIKNICEAIKVCIFGRGADANANIQLGDFGAVWASDDAICGAGTVQGNVQDEEDWAGLPEAIQRSTEEV